ncbi:hypothetical protein J1N35_018738, partial [Gossypium stocksii]
MLPIKTEFYSTFHFQRHGQFSLDTLGIITFQLLGTTHSLSHTDFNIALAFVTEDYAMSTNYENSLYPFLVDFKAIEDFTLLTDNAKTTYSPKTSKDLWLKRCIGYIIEDRIIFIMVSDLDWLNESLGRKNST